MSTHLFLFLILVLFSLSLVSFDGVPDTTFKILHRLWMMLSFSRRIRLSSDYPLASRGKSIQSNEGLSWLEAAFQTWNENMSVKRWFAPSPWVFVWAPPHWQIPNSNDCLFSARRPPQPAPYFQGLLAFFLSSIVSSQVNPAWALLTKMQMAVFWSSFCAFHLSWIFTF